MTDRFESVAVPMHRLSDGRPFITDEAMFDDPDLLAFVRRFPNYWVRTEQVGLNLCGVVGPVPEPDERRSE